MNTLKNISRGQKSSLFATLLLCGLALNSKAYSGFDEFGGPVTIVLQSPTVMTYGSPVVSNAPMALNIFTGVAKMDVYSWTNGGGAVALNAYTSPDMTNWTLLPNFAIATNQSFKMTNYMYAGTNLFTTNTYNLPYVVTAGNATNGFTTSFPSYPGSTQFTNTFPLTITKQGVYTLGFKIDDMAGRYLVITETGTGANTNGTFMATVTANPRAQIYPAQ